MCRVRRAATVAWGPSLEDGPMLMSTLDGVETFPAYPELAGKRVLLTGLSRQHGVDIARAFAEHRTRLVLQVTDDCAETQAVAEIAAQAALDMRVFTGPLLG